MDVTATLAALTDKPSMSWPFVLAVVVATTVMVMLTRRRIARNAKSGHPGRRSAPPPATRRSAMDRDLREIMIELENLARQVNAQIDTKFHKLEAVIRDADQRIAHLERLQPDRVSPSGHLDVTVGGAHTTVPVRNAVDARSPRDHGAVHKLQDAGLTPAEIARELGRAKGEIDLILALRRQEVQAEA